MLCTQHCLYTTRDIQHRHIIAYNTCTQHHTYNMYNIYTTVVLHMERPHSLQQATQLLGETFLEHSSIHLDQRKKAKESEKAQGKIWISNYSWISLQLLSYVYDFLVSFGINGTCISLLSYVLSLAWRIPWIDNGLSLVISSISMVLWVSHLIVLLLLLMHLWLCFELLVLGALV